MTRACSEGDEPAATDCLSGASYYFLDALSALLIDTVGATVKDW